MPDPQPPTPTLGRLDVMRRVGEVSIWESRQPAGFATEDHGHGDPSLCLVLAGQIDDDSPGSAPLGAGAAVLTPSGHSGQVRVGPQGARCLLVESSEEGWSELLGVPSVPSTAEARQEDSGLALALSADLRDDDDDALYTRLVELCAAWSGSRRARGGIPRFLKRALALIDEAPGEDWSLSRAALEVGVHRVTLARAFRGHLKTTLGRHLRSKRLGRAATLIAEGWDPAEVAFECGFSDQSHLTRLFHGRFGAPPVRFRRRLERAREATEVQDREAARA